MKKRLLILGLIMVLTLTACSGGKEAKKKDVSTINKKSEEVKKDEKKDHPMYDEFEFTITEEPVDNYGKFEVTNNSEFSIEYVKLLYGNDENESYMLMNSDSMLPGDTISEKQFMVDSVEAYREYNPKWMEVGYIDESKESHMYRYDYKLEKYDYYK